MWKQLLRGQAWALQTYPMGLPIDKPIATEVLFYVLTIATQRSNELIPRSLPKHKAATPFSKPPLPRSPAFCTVGVGRAVADFVPNSRFCRILAFSGLSQHVASLPLLPSPTPPFHEFLAPSSLHCQAAQETWTLLGFCWADLVYWGLSQGSASTAKWPKGQFFHWDPGPTFNICYVTLIYTHAHTIYMYIFTHIHTRTIYVYVKYVCIYIYVT